MSQSVVVDALTEWRWRAVRVQWCDVRSWLIRTMDRSNATSTRCTGRAVSCTVAEASLWSVNPASSASNTDCGLMTHRSVQVYTRRPPAALYRPTIIIIIILIVSLFRLTNRNHNNSCHAGQHRLARRPEQQLSLIHIWRCRRIERCRSRWSPYH